MQTSKILFEKFFLTVILTHCFNYYILYYFKAHLEYG